MSSADFLIISDIFKTASIFIPAFEDARFIHIYADFEDTGFKSIIKAVVDLDGGDNDDLEEYRYDTPIEDLINDIDAGYGITVLDVNLNER